MLDRLKPSFRVPATRGKMGATEYYTATLAFGAVTKLFVFDPAEMLELSPENRSQRVLKTKRIPEIARYIIDHDDYIFSSITVSVDSDGVEFVEVQDGVDIGLLVLPLEAKYVINDGQHRVAGIQEALRADPTLASDTISVVVLPDGGLERSQQIFSDLNRTVHKTSKSLDILYDHRLPINRITMACMEQVDLFQKRIDKERVSLSVRSPKFATLSGLQEANKQLLGKLDERVSPMDEKKLTSWAIEYWTRLAGPGRALAGHPRRGHETPRSPPRIHLVIRPGPVGTGRCRKDSGGCRETGQRELGGPAGRVDKYRLAEEQSRLAGNLHGRARGGDPYAHQTSNSPLHPVEDRPEPTAPANGDFRRTSSRCRCPPESHREWEVTHQNLSSNRRRLPMSKKRTLTKGRIPYTSRALLQDAQEAMGTDLVRGLIELITNSDDGYVRQNRSGPIRVEVDHSRQKGFHEVVVSDRAGGMSFKEMHDRLLPIGGRSSGLNEGQPVRGNRGRGAKDLVAFGQVEFTSIKDGRISSVRLRQTGEYEFTRQDDKPTQEKRDQLGIRRGNGTVVAVFLRGSTAPQARQAEG